MRLVWLFLGLVVLVLVPFFVWGGTLERMFTQSGTVDWLRDYGSWAWAAALLLLMSDLVLPVPGTVVMAALGYLYGFLGGGLLAAAGSFLSGTVGYGLCRGVGRGAAAWLLGEEDLAKGERLFAEVGGWLVVLSRWLPVFPEVIACMAGLTRMPARPFFLALACGALPLGFTFAAVGRAGVEYPVLALVLSALLPPALWIAVRPVFKKKAGLE